MSDRFMRAGPAFVLVAVALAVLQTQAQTPVTGLTDGVVKVSVDGRQLLVPADIDEVLVVAVRDNVNDPQALRQAIQAIIAEHAGTPDDVDLATAISVVAIYYAGVRSAATDAIIRGASDSNPSVSAEMLLATLPVLRARPQGRVAAEKWRSHLQATVENPSQVSRVERGE